MIRFGRHKKHLGEKYLELNASMQGRLVFSDAVNLRICGKFEGDLITRGRLIIAKGAEVKANISGENILISGKVHGAIRASKLLVLTSSAHVHADVEAVHFSVEDGAVFNGHCRMMPKKMSVTELCDYLSVEEDKILSWVNSGQIPAEKTGGEIVFDHKAVENWLAQHA